MAYFKEDPDKILVHGRDEHKYDGMAGAAVQPGEVLTITGTDGEYPVLEPGASETLRVAKEYSHTGMTVDDSYSADDHMEYYHLYTGEVAQLHLASGENVSVDDGLVVNSNGYLQAYVSADNDAGEIVAYANEAVDNSSGSDPVFMLVTAR